MSPELQPGDLILFLDTDESCFLLRLNEHFSWPSWDVQWSGTVPEASWRSRLSNTPVRDGYGKVLSSVFKNMCKPYKFIGFSQWIVGKKINKYKTIYDFI